MFVGRQHQHEAPHPEVKLATELCACQLILAGPVCGEVHPNRHSRNQILFEPELGNPEIMNNVSGAQDELDWPSCRNRNYAVRHIIFGIWIGLVQANIVERRIVDKVWIRAPEDSVFARVMEVPLKLLSNDFNLE